MYAKSNKQLGHIDKNTKKQEDMTNGRSKEKRVENIKLKLRMEIVYDIILCLDNKTK